MQKKFYIWQNGMCITYLLRLRQIEEFFIRNDWEKTDSMEEADCVLIGACAAFEPYFGMYAEKISAVSLKRSTLVVYGCLPTVNREFYDKCTDKKAIFIPTLFPSRIENVIGSPKVKWKDIPMPAEFRKSDYSNYDHRQRFILLQEGCSENCYYCPHRLAIGRPKSIPADMIAGQIRKELAKGGSIFVLGRNDCGSWGFDLDPKQRYPDLLKAVLNINDKIEIHIGDFSPKWLGEYGSSLSHRQISDIKVPIQSVSSRLLTQMGRNPCVTEFGPILKVLKSESHKPKLRTEIIIGLPTSTESELMDTLEFVAEHFDKVACFSYDFHKYTRIARMGIPLLSDDVIVKHVQLAMAFARKHPKVDFVFNERGRICAQLTKANAFAKV